jgi:glycosyltransferase involved in cell wall biosynthesis
MNILHVVAGTIHGGAARAAYAIHSALRRRGIESRLLLSQEELVDDPSIVQIELDPEGSANREYRVRLDQFPLNCYPDRMASGQQGGMFSPGVAGIRLEDLPPFAEADIIHLHWINGLVSIEGIRIMTKPVVWTMHDLWPFTGGCHYSGSCTGFSSGCGCCPQLGSHDADDLSSLVVKRKLMCYGSNLYPVAVSDWLRGLAHDSVVFRNTSVRMIPNCVDTDTFAPLPKKEARKRLGLTSEKRIILFGAINAVQDPRKGFRLLVQALQNLSRKSDCQLVVFGCNPTDGIPSLSEAGFEVRCFGHIHDDRLLAALYSSADLFVAPSIQETFGRTIIEAMACGTPVVAFGSTGPNELVSHQVTGYLAQPYDPEDLKDGMDWILSLDMQTYGRMSVLCRQETIKKYSFDIVSGQYLSLYKEILGQQHAGMEECSTDPVALLAHEIKTGSPHHFQEKTVRLFRLYREYSIKHDAMIFLWDRATLLEHLHQAAANGREIAVFGTGAMGRRVCRQLFEMNVPVAYFVDNDPKKWGHDLEGLKIVSLSDAKNAFFVISSNWHQEISEQLQQSGRAKLTDYVIVR